MALLLCVLRVSLTFCYEPCFLLAVFVFVIVIIKSALMTI